MNKERRYADMAKLVDAPDLGSGAAKRVGSTPTIRTKFMGTRRRVSWGECRAALGGNGIEVD